MRFRAIALTSVLVGIVVVAVASPLIHRQFPTVTSATIPAAVPAPAPPTAPGAAARLGAIGAGAVSSGVLDPGAGRQSDLPNRTTGDIAPSPDTAGGTTPRYRAVSVAGTVFFGWSLLNRATQAITGSANRELGTSSTESMIKAWIASDYLRRLAASGDTPTATALHELTLMIINSDDDMAQKYYVIDGGDAVVARLISICGLQHTKVHNGWWSKTQMSPADAVRYGVCVANGQAAGPQWTQWILDAMAHVRGGVTDQQATTGGGRWGIISALPAAIAATTSIKNGWTEYAGVWHVNCLAIQKTWVLSVMMRYPAGDGLAFGANVCALVTRQLLDPVPAPTTRPPLRAVAN